MQRYEGSNREQLDLTSEQFSQRGSFAPESDNSPGRPDAGMLPASAKAKPAARDQRLDFLRGLCIVGMVSWHLLSDPVFPTWLSFPVIQAFNFVAEGFVLLAGVSIGVVTKRTPGHPLRVAYFLRRGLHLLIVHYAIVGLLYLAFEAPRLGGVLAASRWPGRVIEVLSLRYQPYLADVLSLFVFLFLATPALLAVRRTLGEAMLLAASLAVYIAAIAKEFSVAPLWERALTLNSGGAFDFNSWQLIFVAGIVLGFHLGPWFDRVREGFRWLFPVVVIGFVLVGVCRFLLLANGDTLGEWRPLVENRHPLAPLRLTYVAFQLSLIALLTIKYWDRIGRGRAARVVTCFGRHSLSVFVVSIFLDYALKRSLLRGVPGLPIGLASWVAELVILYALSWTLERLPRPRRGTAAPW